VLDNIVGQDIFIACAAVSDYSIKNIAKNKIKKFLMIFRPNFCLLLFSIFMRFPWVKNNTSFSSLLKPKSQSENIGILGFLMVLSKKQSFIFFS
jgi:hypothetical protein